MTSEYTGGGEYAYSITKLNEIKEIYSFLDEDIIIYPDENPGYNAEVYMTMNNGRKVYFRIECHEKYWPEPIRNLISE